MKGMKGKDSIDHRARAIENIQRLRPRPQNQPKEEENPYVLPKWPEIGERIRVTLDVGENVLLSEGDFLGFFTIGEKTFIKILADLTTAFPVDRILELTIVKEEENGEPEPST